MKKFVMYGAGNIGRGFIGQLFSNAGYKVGFVDINKEVINRLMQSGSEVYRANYHRDVTFFFDAKKITGVKYKAID